MSIVAAVDCDWVIPQLAVGGCFSPELAEHLAMRMSVRRIVDLRIEARDDEVLLLRYGIELLHLPTLDGGAVSMEMIERGVLWVNRQIDAGERVLVHCQYGIGRSALLACCVLVSRGLPPAAALDQVKSARARISPSPEQLRAFLEWSNAWHRAHSRPSPPDSYEDLEAIAYRHLAS